jgi:hypothetical protein
MARLVRRQRTDGKFSYQVTWDLGGNGRGQSETFASEARAGSFKEDVEAAGHQWPQGWVRGEGYAAATSKPAGPRVAEVAKDYFEAQGRRVKRGKVTPYTVHRYERGGNISGGERKGARHGTASLIRRFRWPLDIPSV